jgi:trigger factor
LKIATEPREDHQVTLIAEVEPAEFEKSKRQAARKISQDRKIPGFRPGKAPYDMVKRFVGEDLIRQQAIDLMIDDVYPKAIEQAGLKPGAPGSLEKVQEEEPVKFTFVVPLAPEVDLGDYHAVRLPYEPPQVPDSEVDSFIERLRSSYASYEQVERPAEEGDMVYVTINGQLANPEEGKNPVILENRPLTVAVKPQVDHPEQEWPFPGFAMQLIGLSAGEEKSFTHNFSEDSIYTSLRGKEINFQVKVESVKKMNLPELNAEFAQTVGEFENLEGLRKAVRESLESQSREEYDSDYNVRLVDAIRASATLKYPPQMVEDEVHSMLHSVEDDLAKQNMDLETYLKVRNQDRDNYIKDEIRPAATRRLERSLILEEASKAEKIQLNQNEVEAAYSQTMTEMQNTGDIDKLRKQMPMNRLTNAIAIDAINRVMNRQVLLRLRDIATGKAEEAAQTENDQPASSEQPETLASSETSQPEPETDQGEDQVSESNQE